MLHKLSLEHSSSSNLINTFGDLFRHTYMSPICCVKTHYIQCINLEDNICIHKKLKNKAHLNGPFDNHFYNLNSELICYLHSLCSFNLNKKKLKSILNFDKCYEVCQCLDVKIERWLKENPICFTNLKENKIWDCVYVEGGGLYPLFTPSRYEISILSKSSETSWELFQLGHIFNKMSIFSIYQSFSLIQLYFLSLISSLVAKWVYERL